MTDAKQDRQSNNSQPSVGIKLNHDMARMCIGTPNDEQCEKLAIAEVRSNSTVGMSLAYQDCKSKLGLDLDSFGKMCDEINSLENEAGQGRLASNAQAIKGKMDEYIGFLKHAREDVFNKSVHAQSWVGRSVASYEIELLLRFEDVVNRLRKLWSLLDASESELRNKIATIQELSRPLQSVIKILERKLSKFLHECIVAVTNGAQFIKKEISFASEIQMNGSSDEEDDWKVVLPSSSATSFGKGKKNKKTKKANKGKGKKK